MSAAPRLTEVPAGLSYSSDSDPGIQRIKRGRGFTYQMPDGSPPAEEYMERIRNLAIPPAYRDVWICLDPQGHLQATGRDSRGRKQYRYHPKWSEAQAESKFEHMVEFGQALPCIRERIKSDLRTRGLNRNRVIAAVIALLEKSLIRIGNREYARENQTYGLTTILNEHAEVNTTSVHFEFIGKSGKKWEVDVRDRQLAGIVRQLQELPGQHLFGYVGEDGSPHHITSSDVNEYLREISPFPITAKDFRTWAATREAFSALCECEGARQLRDRKRVIKEVVAQVSDVLGNTPAVCRSSYIHPRVLETAIEKLPITCKECEDPEETLLEFLSAAAESQASD